ncbi:MAG: DUF1311 domain-containing protein [Glaciimonas sp.]|nr:DUF1311 domain-containing protein [Glaciimonas sp.]
MKQITWIVLTWLAFGCSVQAAGFDCATAQTKVEKLICADAELSKLDEYLASAYSAALKVDGNAAYVRQEQKQWVKERNACVDASCVKNAYQNRLWAMAQSTQSTEGIEELYGKWEAGGTGGLAVYGMMKISKSKITWKGYNRVDPRCTVSYEQVPEGDVIKIKVDPDHFQNISPFKSYVLAIHGGCALKITYFRLTLPDNMPNYLDMIEYSDDFAEAVGYVHFYKR